jgi:type III pantothenate kinase
VEVDAALPQLGLPFHYPKPQELGTDRLAAAVAAHAWGQYPAIIVACGTATAFTVLDAKGRFCGGAIAPGLQTQLAALLGRTAQLPDTLLKQPRSALGKSTQEAIRAGVMLNFQGGAKEIIRQLSGKLPRSPKPHLILTGGNAPLLAKNLDVPFTLRPLLIFEGLLIIGFRKFGSL